MQLTTLITTFVEEYGRYWSSSPVEDDNLEAYILNFIKSDRSVRDNLSEGRFAGLPVRPVAE